MFFHDKPGWGIALRIVLVLLLIGGMAWITRAAFYKGVASGTGKVGPGYMMHSGDDDMAEFHHQDGYEDYHGNSGYMSSHHPGTAMPHSGFGGPMGHRSGGGFGSGAFHFLFGILGVFLLVKLMMGMGGRRMYYRGPGYYGHHRHHPHHGSHQCECECCREDQVKEEPETKPGKSKKKS